MSAAILIAMHEAEDLGHVMYGNGNGVFFTRKSDGKVLALPMTRETFALYQRIRSEKLTFIGDALANFTTDVRWKSPRSLGLKAPGDKHLHAA